MNRKLVSILIIEDEPDIRQFISFNLKKNNYKVQTAINGEEGLSITKKHKPDIVILDLMLPGIHGLEVCRLLNKNKGTKNIPIIMLTALGQEENIIKGLEAGADDYITKPFSVSILIARVRTALRRTVNPTTRDKDRVLSFQNITIYPDRYELYVDDVQVVLNHTEFKLLCHLASQPGRVFSRYQIIDAMQGGSDFVTKRLVDVLLVSIRKKLGTASSVIQTVRGVGYKFKVPE